ncbi:FAD dependent oxidoreductase [Hypoxylon fragiforme]|uniref:FAD dependent oxidoreductase n=1 Tax=Hypoxylon fragiforme TaxID=63214 RepID=UPI0020C733A9|nr:FAD dependent oxidoreductase [Hypoxylon fragiforme]KAI2609433.1 FAD dependent oxidoreductase [Hypoxylon fragiforme]
MFPRTARRSFQPFKLISLAHSFSSTAPARTDFDHVVIGGGVVGLAIARALASRASSSSTTTSSSSSSSSSTSTLLLERHPQVGTETSSRNSEVIHAGLYYGPSSLKTRLCVTGRQALYRFCAERGVPHRRTGKWIVAQDEEQMESLRRVHAVCSSGDSVLGPTTTPTRWVGRDEAQAKEPWVRAEAGILESPETGIVDSHGLMAALHGLFEDAGGVTALNSSVVGIEPLPSSPGSSGAPGSSGWRLTVRDTSTGSDSCITAATLVNSAGLGAADIHNMIVPAAQRLRLYYAKGNYFSYSPASSPSPKVSRLIYPVTPPGAGGLGTHLTLDMAGRMRFGPDVEWVDSPDDLSVNTARLPAALREIKRYLPAVDVEALTPDYAGIRPKLQPSGAVGASGGGKGGGGGFVDFYIREEEGYRGWVNLLGIESPGLTSCLAIAGLVEEMLYGSSKVEV